MSCQVKSDHKINEMLIPVDKATRQYRYTLEDNSSYAIVVVCTTSHIVDYNDVKGDNSNYSKVGIKEVSIRNKHLAPGPDPI